MGEKMIINLPQNPFTVTSIFYGRLYSEGFYKALRLLMEANPGVTFQPPNMTLEQEQRDPDGTKVHWDAIEKELGRPW